MASIINQVFKSTAYSATTDYALADEFWNLAKLFWKTRKPFETLFLCTRTPETHPLFNHPHGWRHRLPPKAKAVLVPQTIRQTTDTAS